MMMADDNEDDNNNDTNAQYKALWNLLTKYGIDRFSNDEELDAYMETVKIATGASDQQIKRIKEHAINLRNSPYGNPTQTSTTQAATKTNTFDTLMANAPKQNKKTRTNNTTTKTSKRSTPALLTTTDNRGGDRRSIKATPRTSDQSTLNFGASNNNDTTDGGTNDLLEDGDDNTDRIEEEARRKASEKKAMAHALDELTKYKASIPNGTIDEVPDNDDYDSDIELVGDGGINSNTNNEKKKKRRSYLPGAGSPIKEYLDSVRDKVFPKNITINNPPLNLTKMSPWIPPPINALSTGLGDNAKPNKFYVGNTWVYVWDPIKQYASKMPPKYVCFKCKSSDTKYLRSCWKPFHWWDRIVYVLHKWVQCKSCGCCFRTIDPRCLSTLPTKVAEQFPFVSPTQYGPGLYAPMVLMLVALMPSSILYGTFAKVINILLRVNYAKTHLSYLEEVQHWKTDGKPVLVSNPIPTPFSSFDDQSGYGGVTLKSSLLSRALRLFMGTFEKYMQASFQFGCDEGVSTDDSHKLTSHVYVNVGKSKVQPFTACYSAISLSGLPNISRFKFTKSSDELKMIIPKWVECRKNAGQTELLRLEGDNASADSSQQLSASSSLLKDVVPYRETTDMPKFEVTEEHYKYITTHEGLKTIALTLLSQVQEMTKNGRTLRIGLDTEFDADDIYVISLYFEGDTNIGTEAVSILIHPHNWGDTFEDTMQSLLEHEDVVIVCLNAGSDIQRLRKKYGIKFKRIRDVARYCLHDDPNQRKSLQMLTGKYLGYHVDKNHQRSNFNVNPPMAAPLRNYAMADAILVIMIDTAITKRLVNAGIDSFKYEIDLQPGTEVTIKIGGVEAAIAKIDTIGERGRGAGETTLWGTQYIGAKKALVKVVTILVRGAKVPFQHSDWGDGRLTLGEASDREDWNNILAVRTSQIHRKLGEHNTQVPRAPVAINTQAASTSTREEVPTTAATAAVSALNEATVDANKPIEVVNNVDSIRSREKSDIWHEHDNVPLPRDSPATTFIHELLRHATMTINEVDKANVERVLAAKGITDFDNHFRHNKEWWYIRVRMPPRQNDVASANLMRVLEYLRSEDGPFKEYVTEDMTKHILGWARRCREGRYDDLPDVEMYQHDGVDSNGLNKWLRRRGSKAEIFHQKMHVAVGPFGIGIETAHYLQVILAYQYLVSSRIRRRGEPDFGHFMLNLEDRIQEKIRQLWGVDPFPSRINMSEQTALYFVSVGVGPLSLNEDYVTVGEPGEGLKDGLYFMANRMKVKYPPLPPTTPAEFSIIKKFCAENPQPTQNDYKKLCKIFKSKSNGTTIWPKLLPMCKPFVKKWKNNQLRELLEIKAGKSYTNIINKLKSDTISLPPPMNSRPQVLTVHQQHRKNQQQQSPTTTNTTTTTTTTTTTANDTTYQQGRAFVPPLSAPAQTATVPVPTITASQTKGGKCAFWPICQDDRTTCGGVRHELCKTYGTNGTKTTPSSTELSYQQRLHTWSDYEKKKKNCFWFPFCGKALDCGGKTKGLCSKFGKGHSPPCSEEELKNKKAAAKAEARRKKILKLLRY